MSKLLNKKNIYYLFTFVLLSVGVFFRVYMPKLYGFGFDQVQILSNAESIAHGKITLIGPRTGPANMFTGPLVYYITAFFLLFIQSPWAIVAMSGAIATVTGICIFSLTKKYLSLKEAFFILIIWVFSPLLIEYDRIAWNPNLTLLASSLVFFPMLGIIKQNKINKIDLFYLFIGGFLGFQAHFSGLLLPALLLITLVTFRRRLSALPIVASGIGLIFSILPTLLFDARHGWINTKGFIKFISEKESVGGALFFQRLKHSLEISLEIFGKLIPFQLGRETSIYLGLFLVIILLWFIFNKSKQDDNKNIFISLFWSISIVIILNFYRSNSPKYYFFIYLPAAFVLISNLFFRLVNTKYVNFRLAIKLTIVLFVYIYLNFAHIFSNASLSIGNQLNLAKDILVFSKKHKISKVAYDIFAVDSLGMHYFIDNLVTFSNDGQVIHISHLDKENDRYGQYGLWVDPRTNPQLNYLVLKNKIIETASNVILLEDKYFGAKFSSNKTFQVALNGKLTGELIVVVDKIDNPFIPDYKIFGELKDNAFSIKPLASKKNKDGWKGVKYKNYLGYIKEYETFLLVYITKKTPEEFLSNSIKINATSVIPGKI